MERGYKIFSRGKEFRENWDRIFNKFCHVCGSPINDGIDICETCRIELRNERRRGGSDGED